MDINKLKETGNVTVVRTEENDMVQETIDYISHDGKTAFTKVQSYYTKDAYMHKLQQLNELKQAAVIRQDFELAAKYRDEAKALEDAQPNEAK
jgi:protein-arginine kinase activator protein McsA